MYFVFVLQDERIDAGTSMYKGRKLFYCKKDYALFVPLETVLHEKDFDAISDAEQNDQEKLCAQKVEQTLRNEAAAKSLVFDNSRTKGTFKVHWQLSVFPLFFASFSSSLQYFPVAFYSCFVDLRQVAFGLPLFLFPWGFHFSACLVTLFFGLRWPIQPQLRRRICTSTLSCPVFSHSSSFLTLFYHLTASIC